MIRNFPKHFALISQNLPSFDLFINCVLKQLKSQCIFTLIVSIMCFVISSLLNKNTEKLLSRFGKLHYIIISSLCFNVSEIVKLSFHKLDSAHIL